MQEASGLRGLSNPSLRDQAQERLVQRLPGLVHVGVYQFPLSSGTCRQTTNCPTISAIAVVNIPVSECLDEDVASDIAKLAAGARRTSKEISSQVITEEITNSSGVVAAKLVVNWHNCVDFAKLVAKGTPACVEVLGRSIQGDGVLLTTESWQLLASSLSIHLASTTLVSRLAKYMKSLTGAARSMIHKKGGSTTGDPESIDKICQQLAFALNIEIVDDDLTRFLESAVCMIRNDTAFEHTLGQCLDCWCQGLREDALQKFAETLQTSESVGGEMECWERRLREQECIGGWSGNAAHPINQRHSESKDFDSEGAFDVKSLLPDGSGLVMSCQVGSYMYDLQVETSDEDYKIIFQSPLSDLLSVRPGPTEFNHHEARGFAADKKGVIEYSGQELGLFVLELAKGNPKNVELLFSAKPMRTNWVWEEIRCSRNCFLTQRCARQYHGFISDAVRRLKTILQEAEADPDAHALVNSSLAVKASKLLYHARHKSLELGRILRGQAPIVALKGDERDEVLAMRRQPAKTVDELRSLVADAETLKRDLITQLQEVEDCSRLPAEVDAEFLISWLRGVRCRNVLDK